MSSLPRLRARLLSGDELSANDVCALLAMCDLYEAIKVDHVQNRGGPNARLYFEHQIPALAAVDEALAGLTDSEGEGQ